MFPFLETIKIENGKVHHQFLHQQRVDATIFEVFSVHNLIIKLDKIFEETKKKGLFPKEQNQIFKCRLLYDADAFFIEFIPYQIKKIDSLKIVQVPTQFDYHLKYADRKKLNELIIDNQEVIIVKNNLLTDTTYSNIALFKENQWFTPNEPLLNGTMRQFLIKQKIIKPFPIKISDLKQFSQIKLFNAMMDWENAIEIEVNKIII